jgi:hypothetical protein
MDRGYPKTYFFPARPKKRVRTTMAAFVAWELQEVGIRLTAVRHGMPLCLAQDRATSRKMSGAPE